MNSIFSVLLTVLALSGCGLFHDIEISPRSEQATDGGKCPGTPDLASPAAKCAAAKGLEGENLLCVDFSALPNQVLGSPPPSQLNGWDFNSPPNCWEIANGKLQVKNFSTFMSSCGFLLPALSPSDYQKYNSFTLAVVQKIHLESTLQQAQVMLGGDDDQRRLLDWMTGKQPRKQWTQTIAKADLPPLAAGMFQPLFKLTSNIMGGGFQGWQIESIAVMGHTQ